MDTTYFPQPIDEALRLESSVSKTASYNSTSIDQGALYAPGGVGQPLGAVVASSVVDRTTGDETYTAVLQESDDDSTFTACGPIIPITAAGMVLVPGFVSKRYVRVAFVLAGTTPILTFEAWLSPNIC